MLPILVDLDESSMDNSLALAIIIDLKKMHMPICKGNTAAQCFYI